MEAFRDIQLQEGVYVSAQTLGRFSTFEKHYIDIRRKENRVLSIPEIQRLPYPDETNEHHKEWKLRQKNIERLLAYLRQKKGPLRILDIGCGNGFMAYLMAGSNNTVVGVDVNLTELKQAAIAFPEQNITWYYLDLMNELLPEKQFDIITFCASFQYFKDAEKILSICKNMIAPTGEIHIIDSPFYNSVAKTKAVEGSKDYFNKMGVAEMTAHYHHHSLEVFNAFVVDLKYKPGSFLKKCFGIIDSPFPWIKLS